MRWGLNSKNDTRMTWREWALIAALVASALVGGALAM